MINEVFSEVMGELQGDYKSWAYIMYVQGNPAGFVIAQVDSLGGSWCLKPGYGLIREFFIGKKFRRQGYGRALYDYMEEILIKDGVRKFYLTTDTEQGVGFWQFCGYIFTGDICEFNNSGIYEKIRG